MFCHRECPDHTQCLHLTASAGNPANSPGEDWTFLQGHFRRIPLHVRKIGEVGATEKPILIKEFAPENPWIARPEWSQRWAASDTGQLRDIRVKWRGRGGVSHD